MSSSETQRPTHRLRLPLITLGFACATLLASASPNLIQNGTFEDPQITKDSPLSQPTLPCWVGTGNALWVLVNGHITVGWDYPHAPDGNQWVALSDAPSALSAPFLASRDVRTPSLASVMFSTIRVAPIENSSPEREAIT